MYTTKIPFYVDKLTVKSNILWLNTKRRCYLKLYVNYNPISHTFHMPNLTICVDSQSGKSPEEHITLTSSKGLNFPEHPTRDEIDFVVYDQSYIKIMNEFGLHCRFSEDILECPWINESWSFVDDKILK